MSITVSYHLNKRSRDKKAKELSIIGRVSYSFLDKDGEQRRQFKFATGYSCPVKSLKGGKVEGRVADATHVNVKLSEFSQRAETLYKIFESKRDFPQPEAFKDMLYKEVKLVEEERDFIQDLEGYIKDKGSPQRSIVKNLNQLLNRLKAFSVKEKYALGYSSINMQFYNKFKKYCSELKLKDETGLSANTFGGHIKLLKTFLNYAKSNGWNKYEFYKVDSFKITTETIKVIALNQSEVDAIAELKLSNRPRLELSRDFFLLGCETGLRYIDYAGISKRAINEVENGYNLEIRTQKTDAEVVIPLSRLALDILIKYNFDLPKPPSNQKLNENLKVIAELAKVNKELTTHTARRTFATIQYNLKTPIQFIMKITGHKTEKEFYKYIGIDLTKNAEQVRDMHEKYKIEKKGILNTNLKIA
jgi:integrase